MFEKIQRTVESYVVETYNFILYRNSSGNVDNIVTNYFVIIFKKKKLKYQARFETKSGINKIRERNV